ncbi:putative multidrug resistance-associated protein [Trypanosoma cruzi]|uniref:Putative multidrug resistance-associated protein n=1 Tax=Trypanosoma cruzi TaxID=5693 RepID=A0A2V2X5K5_TRYCR|nr:putative multidrug resistance-associated protein [Trypanosoma cruzi]
MSRKEQESVTTTVYAVRLVHAVVLWLAVVFFGISVVFLKRRLPRATPISFYFCCLLGIGGVFVSALYQLAGPRSARGGGGGIFWVTWAGLVCWLLLLMRSVRHANLPDVLFVFLLLALVGMECTGIVLQFISTRSRIADILMDAFIAVPHMLVFVTLVGWDWLMVNDIALVFRENTPIEGDRYEGNNKDDDDDDDGGLGHVHDKKPHAFFLLPPSQDIFIQSSAASSLFGESLRFDGHTSIIRTIVRHWGPTYFLLALVRLLYDFGGLLPAYFLRQLVDNLMQAKTSGKKGKDGGADIHMSIISVLLIVIITLTCTFLRVHYNMKLQKMSLYNRNLLTIELFHSAIRCRRHQLGNQREGEIMNYLSVDVQRVADAVQTINDLWALPLQLAFALYLLYVQVSFAFVAGVVVTIILIPVNMQLAKRIKHVQTSLMRENDERVLTITEIMNNILCVKMCGLSHIVQRWVEIPRSRYMKHLCWLKFLDAFCVFFWAVTPTLVSLLTFITFIWMGGKLTPGKAVTALALFGSLILPLNAYPWVINGSVEAYVSWQRLKPFFFSSKDQGCFFDGTTSVIPGADDEVVLCDVRENIINTNLLEEEQKSLHMPGENQPLLQATNQLMCGVHPVEQHQLNSPKQRQEISSDVLVDIQQGDLILAASSGDDVLEQLFTLRISRFQALRGQLIAVVGHSGSGKSAFLSSLAGELIMTPTFSLTVARSSMAFVEQAPFLMTGTIRENILFGLAFDSARYESVIRAVALDEDLRHNFAPDLDRTFVGDRGRKLSGGQKVRVALARALYANKDLYLVDDFMGCLDTTVAHHIVQEVFVTAAQQGKCVIVVTHNEELIHYADAVYECAGGWLAITERSKATSASSPTWMPREMDHKGKTEEGIGKKTENDSIEDAKPSFRALEVSEHGVIAWSTMNCYLRRVGWGLTVFIVISVAAMQVARNASDQYVVVWSKDGDGDTAAFIHVLSALAVINSLLAFIRGFSFAIGGLRAAHRIHNELLHHVMSATFHFFSNTPPGRIINRLSSDIYTIDDSLPFIINILLAQTFLLMGSMMIIILNSTGIILLTLIPLSLLYYRVQLPYRIVSRELRRLEAAARAPVLDTMREVLLGGVVIRTFGVSVARFYMHRVNEQVGVLLRTQYNALMLNSWFALRLELVGIFLLILVGVLAIYYHGNSHAPMLGLALAYVQPLTSYVNGVIGAFSSTERDLISVERVLQYFYLEREDVMDRDVPLLFFDSWPTRGKIDVVGVSMQYDDSGPKVLQRLTFHVEAGEKLAIVGRTGAGKSSIFLALLRLVKLTEGYIAIDDIDICQLPLDVIRTRLNVIPQNPVIFHGTLRKNVDPLGLHSDDEIRAALACVNLADLSLDSNIVDGGNVCGGKQHQIAVARVLLKRSSLLLLDEPTSQLNSEAESLLWHVLGTHLKETTLLCITHKLSHIDFFDRVIVIDKGRVVNSGSPSILRRDGAWPFA